MFNFTLDLYTTTCKSRCDITTTTTTMNVDVEMSRLLLSSNMCFTFTETNKSTTARNYRQTLRAIYSDTYLVRTIKFQRK